MFQLLIYGFLNISASCGTFFCLIYLQNVCISQDQKSVKEPTRLFESIVVVGLHPNTDLKALEKVALGKKNSGTTKISTSMPRGEEQVEADTNIEPQVLYHRCNVYNELNCISFSFYLSLEWISFQMFLFYFLVEGDDFFLVIFLQIWFSLFYSNNISFFNYYLESNKGSYAFICSMLFFSGSICISSRQTFTTEVQGSTFFLFSRRTRGLVIFF